MALMLASRYGHTNIVQLLLEHGADANLQTKVSSSDNIVCVSVCHTAVYSTTIVVLCGCTIEVNSKEVVLLPYQGSSLSVA